MVIADPEHHKSNRESARMMMMLAFRRNKLFDNPMTSRCDYDTIFHRVSCVTLVALAVTFTVILTNVFVDIDGLLIKKNKAKTYLTQNMPETIHENEISFEKTSRPPNLKQRHIKVYEPYSNYDDEEDDYRSKRSSDSVNQKESNLNSEANIQNLIQLIYNRRTIDNSIEDGNRSVKPKISEPNDFPNNITKESYKLSDTQTNLLKRMKNINLDKFIDRYRNIYIKKYAKPFEHLRTDNKFYNFKEKRLKRQIKIRYEDDEITTVSPKVKKHGNSDDEELFVEIETHFDSKGITGVKKKKMIRKIINKIQKAIHSNTDTDTVKHKEKKQVHFQVQKRVQNRFDRIKAETLNKTTPQIYYVAERYSEPIMNTIFMDKITDKIDETWKKTNIGPGFLSITNSISSAEIKQEGIDVNKVMTANDIFQRFQKPLNMDESEGTQKTNTYFDLGNSKFFIKNIDGIGLSIGFNQYTDEPPDSDSIKLFTGLDSLVQTYTKNYDTKPVNNIENTYDEREHEIYKRNVKSKRKSKKFLHMHEKKHYSNGYTKKVGKNILQHRNYQTIADDTTKELVYTVKEKFLHIKNQDSSNNNIKGKQITLSPLKPSVNDTLYNKKLKTLKALAAMLYRNKRSVNVRKVVHLKNKVRLNRFINVNAMNTKKIIKKKKRNKRQTDKISIIATDSMFAPRQSSENIFLVDDNIFDDRNIIREGAPEAVVDNIEEKVPEEQFKLPYVIENAPYMTNFYNDRSRREEYAPKYPHMFLEEKPMEDIESFTRNEIEVKPEILVKTNHIENLQNKTAFEDQSTPNLNELVNAIEPKQNYKLTVKIFPKNISNLNSGYKEIHTSINKSFNRDGLIYSSLMNVSEISKIEKENEKTTEPTFMDRIKEQQMKLNSLLKNHQKKIDEQLHHLKKEQINLQRIKNSEYIKSTEISNNSSDSLRINKDEIDNLLEFFNMKTTTTTMAPVSEPDKPKSDHKKHANKDLMNEDNIYELLNLLNAQKQATVSTTVTTLIPTTKTSDEELEKIKNQEDKNEFRLNKDYIGKFLALLQSQNSATENNFVQTTEISTKEPSKIYLNQIQRNENVTHEILQQIKKNTELLQTFLLKLDDKLSKDNKNSPKHTKDEDTKPALDLNVPQTWKSFQSIPETIYQQHLQMEALKNKTNFAIPFIYTYQPIPPNNNSQNVPIASFMYHGHLHATSLKQPKFDDVKPKSIRICNGVNTKVNSDRNQTNKYFIDIYDHDDCKMIVDKNVIPKVNPTNTTSTS